MGTVHVKFVQADGSIREIEATVGQTLMQNAKDCAVDGIVAECGGSMVCGTCHVYVAQPWYDVIGPLGTMEADMVEYVIEPRPTSRLSCQIHIVKALDGMEVTVPRSQR